MKIFRLLIMAILSMTLQFVSCTKEVDVNVINDEGPMGLSCWDLNGNGTGESSEDINGDGNFDALDCQSASGGNGTIGLACWDLNGNGIGEPNEDTNNDGMYDALDCQGEQGAQGDPGEPGTDGNANVQRFDIAIPNNFTGPQFSFDIPIDSQELPNYAIFVYLVRIVNGVTGVFSIPGDIAGDDYAHFLYVEETGLAAVTIRNLSDNSPENTLAPGTYNFVRIVAIEYSSGSKSGKESLSAELKAAGVDTADYNVMATYFGLK
ncbi:hypothetical protein AB1A65_04980 [Muricauda sp. ANG21]|uniref:hypothetical protein n=1 Tax=Allomuricauda sp. ANG21 TaxID=3042468 RepID=UPI0034540058